VSGRGRLARLALLVPQHARTALGGFFGHRGPKGDPEGVIVQAVIDGPEGILLTVRVDLRGWELPGGNLDPNETEAQALVREVYEETGLRVEVGELVGDYLRTGFRPHRARLYHCHVLSGTARPSEETPVVRWFAKDALPSTLFPWFRTPIEDFLADLPTPPKRTEHLGLSEILTGFKIDLKMRWTDDKHP